MGNRTSAPPPPRKLHPPCWKKSYGLSLIVFMIGPQFKLTGPSLNGMSTELDGQRSLYTQRWLKENNALEPILDIVQLSARYRVDMERRFRKVFENEDEIKLFQCELDTFQRCDFDLVESDDEERRVDQVDETFGGGLQPNVGSERNTFERQLSERNVHLNGFAGLCIIRSGFGSRECQSNVPKPKQPLRLVPRRA